ncbi:MAG: aminotransferase class I/II-fold pyridoxal phosphate-dependent enzyme [Longimicrobiales bacterium]|nr:aminotransferase class I/II-fold pyridoxal phosphate-dependent enzyme [Longimicrobiales bacterium]
MSKGTEGLELSAATMRAMGYGVVDRLVDRIVGLDEQPAWRGATREEMRSRLDGLGQELGVPLEDGLVGAGGDSPEGFEALLDLLAEQVTPYRGNVDHPRFFAFVPSCPTWPGILGELMAAGLNAFQGTWLESAGPSALELEVLGWFRAWLEYPPESAGLLMSGGSAANLTALVTAREDRLGADWRDGVIYASEETHSSVFRAARILGFHADRIRTVPHDRGFRLRPAALAEAVAEDRSRGLRPFLVVANGGATSTGAVDPLPALTELAREENLWLHVDAAYGGFAILTDRGRTALTGIGDADSVTLDPHKWLYQPFEAGCLMVRDGRKLEDAFHILPDYLQDTEVSRGSVPDDTEVNFADRGLQLTRSWRALKVWLTVRYWGIARIRAAIDRCIDLAERAEARIRESDTLELLTPAALGIVCFKGPGGEEADVRRVQRLSDSGVGMISSTRVRGEYALRLCILGHRSGWEDVVAVIERLERPIDR